ncbi:hypothetical protein JWR97_04905 [Pseudomonas cedrina subsp. fulgida]|nr:hypothetical protein [Pseudomonas cedrina subsp. fulgida]
MKRLESLFSVSIVIMDSTRMQVTQVPPGAKVDVVVAEDAEAAADVTEEVAGVIIR